MEAELRDNARGYKRKMSVSDDENSEKWVEEREEGSSPRGRRLRTPLVTKQRRQRVM